MKYFIFCCAVILPLLLPFDVVASSTSEHSMDAVHKNMNRIQDYMQNHPPHLPTDNNTMQHSQIPYAHSQIQPQINTNTSMQDKAKLIVLLNKVQLTEEEKQELITIILSK